MSDVTDATPNGSNDLDEYRDLTPEEKVKGVQPYHKESYLRGLYHGEGFTQSEIAEFYSSRGSEVSKSTISRWMDEHDIETEPPMHLRNRSISKSQREDGKVQYHVPDPDAEGETTRFYRHHLVALLAVNADGEWAFDPRKVFAEDTHVHHELASPVALDVPINLRVVGIREHINLHVDGVSDDVVEGVLAAMRRWPNGHDTEVSASSDEHGSQEEEAAEN